MGSNAQIPLAQLSQRLADLRAAIGGSGESKTIPTRIEAIDEALGGGLGWGKVHEWLGVRETGEEGSQHRSRRGFWMPASTLLLEIARSAASASEDGRDRVVWIGPAVWPYPAAITGGSGSRQGLNLGQCLFVRATQPAERLWAADLALRSRAAAAIVADGSGFDLASTRRLQLAAEAGSGVCLLARPASEVSALSAAGTRWMVSRAISPSSHRRWTVELLRCKGRQSLFQTNRTWVVEQDRATRALRLAADILDRPGGTKAGEESVRRTG